MTIKEILAEITAAGETILNDIENANDIRSLEAIKVKYLGKKGVITGFTKHIAQVEVDDKKVLGKEINILKQKATTQIDTREAQIEEETYQASLEADKLDVTLPGRKRKHGTLHPLTLITEQVIDCFTKMGFLTIDGPEIESDYYNFEALNIPKGHPARDSQDSFYLDDTHLLRTQTSPMQIRIMEKVKPPLAIVAPGRVFRRDSIDASHSPVFHQIEGLFVAKNVTFADLKGVLHNFCKEMFGKDVHIRFRPDYFPFTEPSCEISVSCVMCRGKGGTCATCGGDGWLEILGAGMVNPVVLKNVNIDPEEYSGFAFGMGIERIAMIKYGIHDIRLFFENKHQFLKQFKTP
jgi:phenylalanyl-tRNA synthetase alpha chain